jgi:hypothetical protein
MREPVNPRQFALDAIARLPQSATLEDLRDQFQIILGLLESYRDEERGDLVPHAQVRAEVQEWISKATGRVQPAAT